MANSSENLKELLHQWVWKLLEIARRAHALEALTAELHKVSRGKTFEVFNDVVWQMVLDMHSMFVIEFASWAKGVYVPSGLLRLLQGVPPQTPPTGSPGRGVPEGSLRQASSGVVRAALRGCWCLSFAL